MAESTTKKSVFETLASINVSGKVEKKNGLDYLSWAWAWAELMKKYPDSSAKVFEREDGRFWFDDGKSAWVKCSVTINGKEHIEYLPVMDYRNQAIPAEKVTSTDANKAYKRCLTKCIALHGLGLALYASEDIYDKSPSESSKGQERAFSHEITVCHICGKEVKASGQYTASQIVEESTKKLGKPTCMACWKKQYEQSQKMKEEKK